jgi:hypothetical protein
LEVSKIKKYTCHIKKSNKDSKKLKKPVYYSILKNVNQNISKTKTNREKSRLPSYIYTKFPIDWYIKSIKSQKKFNFKSYQKVSKFWPKNVFLGKNSVIRAHVFYSTRLQVLIQIRICALQLKKSFIKKSHTLGVY